jgi:hypothetical protein
MDAASSGQSDVPFYVKGRARGRRRTLTLNLSVRPETKPALRKWANDLFLDTPSDLVEYLVAKHEQGLLFITESADFFAGMALTIEKRAEARALQVAEATTLRVLADRGFVSSAHLK